MKLRFPTKPSNTISGDLDEDRTDERFFESVLGATLLVFAKQYLTKTPLHAENVLSCAGHKEKYVRDLFCAEGSQKVNIT